MTNPPFQVARLLTSAPQFTFIKQGSNVHAAGGKDLLLDCNKTGIEFVRKTLRKKRKN